jgi:hypothetical protein
MDMIQFKSSLSSGEPPEGISDYLKAMWYAGKNDWETSHNIAQDIADTNGSWIHAYLHRVEGDIGNAGYWYSKAKKPMPSYAPGKEWEEIVAALL